MIKLYNSIYPYKDLRDLNKEQFKGAYEYIKEITDNFSEIDTKFLRENPQYLLIIRNALGLSQFEFSKLLGITNKAWVRHFEAGRQGFKHSKMFPRALQLINKLFFDNKIVSYERALLSWQKTRVARRKFFFKYPKPKYNLKRLSGMSKEDFIKYIKLLTKETNNFTNFDTKIIMRTPRFITVFRLLFGLNIRQLCSLLDMQTRRIRKYESFTERMLPETSLKIMNLFKKLTKDKGISLERGLKRFEKSSPFTKLELNIKDILEKNNLPFKIHQDLKSARKKLNVDFVISDAENPLIAIEVTKLNQKGLSIRYNINFRVAYIDHRFQLLKLKYKNLKTILVINCSEGQRNLVKRVIKRETVNTDFYFVNKFDNLGKRIKEIL